MQYREVDGESIHLEHALSVCCINFLLEMF